MTAPPRRLGDRYELGALLGYGGMAEVHLGSDVRLGRDVAVKTLRADLARDPAFQIRFRREAQSAAGLNHPSIVAVYDTGVDGTGGDAVSYIVMEYVDGRTLREVLTEERRLLPRRALEITSEVCAALDYSHRHGIVHRDIKPGNVMLTRTGGVKVMDFGIARAVTASQATMTQTAAVIGTAAYLSPEQARGEPVDARSDIYSTGCLLYELLTGRPPFTGDSPVSVAYQHVREAPPPPSRVDPDLPPEIDAIVLKAMAKNPANRYQSAAEMREDIERSLAGQPVLATPVLSESATTVLARAGATADSTLLLRRPAQADRRGRGLAFTLLALALLALLTAGFLLTRGVFGGGGGGGDTVGVPKLTGQTRAEAEATLSDAGLTRGKVAEEFNAAAVGTVFAQSPNEGSKVNKGDPVDISVSKGASPVRVPALVGKTQDQAVAALTAAGLVPGNITPQDSKRPPGEVLNSDPPAGTAVAADSKVALVVSSGTIPVPNVINLTEAAARRALAGFNVVVRRVPNDTVDPGVVFAQSPLAPGPAPAGSKVVITVALAPPSPSPSPSPSPLPSPSPPTSPSPPPSSPPPTP